MCYKFLKRLNHIIKEIYSLYFLKNNRLKTFIIIFFNGVSKYLNMNKLRTIEIRIIDTGNFQFKFSKPTLLIMYLMTNWWIMYKEKLDSPKITRNLLDKHFPNMPFEKENE